MPIIFGYKKFFLTTLTAILVMSGFFVAKNVSANTVDINLTGIGNYSDWDQSGGAGGTLDLQKIDSVNNDDQDSSYIYQSSNGQIQTFGIANNNIPAGSLVNSVTVTVVARIVGGGSQAFKILLEQGLNQTDNGSGLSIYPTSSYQSYNRVMTTNPLTDSAWTADQINSSAVNFGVLRTNASGTIRITQIFVTIDYTSTTLAVAKIVINHGATKSIFDFQLFVNSTAVLSGVENILDVGSYVVSETNDSNYNSSISGDCDVLGNINLVAGDSKQCIIVNEEKLAYLTIHKNVISNVGSLGVADFAPYRVNNIETPIDTATAFDSGNYTVTEVTDPDYIATFSGDCDSNGNLTLASGNDKTCIITNTKITQLVVTKIVINHGLSRQVSDFPLFVNGFLVSSGDQNIFDPGNYVVSETTDLEYDVTISGDCDNFGNVSLAVGDSKQCVIVNEEKLAYLTVHKNIINHINNLNASDFAPYKVDDVVTELNVATVFDSGSYVVTETTNPNYIATFSGDCDLLGAVVLNSGDSKICTITNEDGHLPYVNNLDFNNGQCSGIPGSGIVNFSWDYQEFNGNNQSKFQFQMALSSDPNFSSPIIDRTFDNLSNPPNTQNQQSVMINLVNVNDTILYNTPYIWRVKVWDSADNNSDWILGAPYQKTGHPDPYVDFTFSPLNPNAKTITTFVNNSVCYNASGSNACQSYAWNFGDGNTSSVYNPTNTYEAQGNFNIILKTYDEVGFCETNQSINVNSAITYNLPTWKEISPFITYNGACFSQFAECVQNSECCSNFCHQYYDSEAGLLGYCDVPAIPPICLPPGDFCTANSQCCSNACGSDFGYDPICL